MAWRREERQRLLEARMRSPVSERQEASLRIAARLDALWRGQGRLNPGGIVSAYWPLRGEPDLRPWLTALHEQGLVCVLPVVVEKGAPLQFRRWFPGCAMEKGFWNIPVPADPTTFVPQLLIAPVVGFDRQCYRLGYGGGYFDRWLAAHPHVTAVGVAWAVGEVSEAEFAAEPHDLPLALVVTERGVVS